MNLIAQFKEMRKQRGSAYKPRTKHLDEQGWAKYTNRLFLESSPYLLQHAHNPVNWYPWGDEAFQTAQEKGLPILLSVGYATCHWCHVMEEESFEDLEVARYMNENYIAVKVDREERPDVDAVYMSAVQAVTGRGGGPMTVWLAPDRRPFYGGTYFPARDGDRGMPMGFLTLLQRLRETYDQKPDLIRQTGAQLTEALQKMLAPEKGTKKPGVQVLETALTQLKRSYDKVNGGVVGTPKFPSAMPVRLLLRYYRRTLDETALKMARQTLAKMAGGGMYDQVGGGFYSATDADSLNSEGENEEGYYFTWTPESLEAVLDKETARAVARYFDVTESGNFEGRSILNIKEPAAAAARDLGISETALLRLISSARPKLFAHRNKRFIPLRDEKILTTWNGLMISAFARSGLLLENPAYVQTARKAAMFILDNSCKNNQLFRSYKDGRAIHKGYLDDYAFFIAALLDLFEADPDPFWFETAVALDTFMSTHFEDTKDGGFFMTADNHEGLIAREKPGYDGALPSGNAVAAMNLFRLYEFATHDSYRKRAASTLLAFSKTFESSPLGLTEMMLALEFSLDSPKQVVIVFPKGQSLEILPFLKEFRKTYLPNRVLIQVEEGEPAEKLAAVIPIAAGKKPTGGTPVAFVCEKGVCLFPSFTPADFAQQIKTIKRLE